MAFTFTWTDKVDNVDFNKAKDVNDLAHGIQETQSAFNALSIPEKVSQLQNDSGYITAEAIPTKVSQLENDEKYGVILRAKGIVEGDGSWIHFDLIPGKIDVRHGTAEVSGRLCVIGAKLDKTAIAELFGV